jgi:hypothetical protein
MVLLKVARITPAPQAAPWSWMVQPVMSMQAEQGL